MEVAYNDSKYQEPYYMLEPPTCSICLGKVLENFTLTKCGHVFHFNCITASLSRKPECPNCRRGGMNSSSVIEVRPPQKKRNIFEYREGESDESFMFNNITSSMQGGQAQHKYNASSKNSNIENDMLCSVCLKPLHNEEVCVPKCKHVNKIILNNRLLI